MKQGEIVNSFSALMWLSNQHMNRDDAWDLYELMEKAEKILQFQSTEERKLVVKFNGISNEDGSVTFKKREDYEQYQKELQKLQDKDAEGLKPLDISLKNNPDVTISPAEIKALKGVVNISKG